MHLADLSWHYLESIGFEGQGHRLKVTIAGAKMWSVHATSTFD